MTSEEIKDGVELSGDKSASSITVVRTSSLDVNTRAATERAAAMTAEAAYVEFYGCKFLSSQDTLYTGGSPQYYRKCKIEGQTDYIFGQNNAVFDVCELMWKGYSGTSYAGFITAARSPGSSYTGYLFNKCKINGSTKLTVKPGY
jgi:pectin methylesterase-like acyl-CoA thioesterase